jgi:hypothetical protein
LEQIAAPAFAHVDHAAVAAVRFGERGAQRLLARRHEDQVHEIVHQAPGEAADAPLAGGGPDAIATTVSGEDARQAGFGRPVTVSFSFKTQILPNCSYPLSTVQL